eukprot:9070299-Prorocentrum_lima.AAC.1
MELCCCSTAPAQMSTVLWDIDASCFITSFDEEEQDTGEVEFYLPPALAHRHSNCPHELKASEQLVLTVNK